MIPSYSSIFNLGHSAVATLLHGDVLIEEKIDGSQISFRINEAGDLEMRSKGAAINIFSPEGLFKQAVEYLTSIKDKIPTGYIFRGEYLAKAKHNMLAYDRVPRNNIIIFDIEYGEQSFVDPTEKARLAAALGLEVVPEIARWLRGSGPVLTAEDAAKVTGTDTLDANTIRGYLEQMSALGGQKIEGVVIKPLRYDLFGRDKKVVMGKFVSEAFKEIHSATWKAEHGLRSPNDIITELLLQYATPARWQKALIHLRELDQIEDSPRDIGKLVAAVPDDVLKECEQEIKDKLFAWGWPQIRRGLPRGLAEWYKSRLLSLQFETRPREQNDPLEQI